MAQQYITLNGIRIKQPDQDMGYDFQVTHTEDSGRLTNGVAHVVPMFTSESFSYTASHVSIAEMREILQIIAKGAIFRMHYFSPYYGTWRDDQFYVGQGSLHIGRLNASEEWYEDLSFTIIGVNPL
jgi:hypothetical protein